VRQHFLRHCQRRIAANEKEKRMMGKLILPIFIMCMWLFASPVSVPAKDKLVVGYTAITGIKAGLWIAAEGRIFEKYGTEIILINTASKMAQAMMGGDDPFAGAGGIAAVSATLKEVKHDRRRQRKSAEAYKPRGTRSSHERAG
jgi:hypothetical protein